MRLFLALAMLSASLAVAEEKPIEIPLKDIWALDMPGTGDVRKLEPQAFGDQVKGLSTKDQIARQRKSDIGQIRAALEWKDEAAPIPGFAVSGIGREALKAARAVLSGKSKRTTLLPADREVTAVFFSRRSGSYVRVYQVERLGNVIEVRYRFIPHDQAYGTEHFALIPLGKLPIQPYQVNFIQEPMEEAKPKAERIVSRSFKFGVK